MAEHRAKLIANRIHKRLWAIVDAMPPIEPNPMYWLDSDCGPSYCRQCVIMARGKEFELGPPLSDRPSYCRTDMEDAFFDGIDGGFDTTNDSTGACDTCGVTLSYILTDYGVEQEVDYYREAPLCVLRGEDTYALDRLALNIWHGSPKGMLLGVSVAINQAFRLLDHTGMPTGKENSGPPHSCPDRNGADTGRAEGRVGTPSDIEQGGAA